MSLNDLALFDVSAIPIALSAPGSLAARFTSPPFSVLDGRSGWWRGRKQEWLDLGITSGEGRGARSYGTVGKAADRFLELWEAGDRSEHSFQEAIKAAGIAEVPARQLTIAGGQSIFDPVLCELVTRWFCPQGGHILDPFAGGSVRGIVAGVLGRGYTGVDLSAGQVAANQAQRVELGPVLQRHPVWVQGDSREVLTSEPYSRSGPYDLVWSCPPYHDLEVYSGDPADISNMEWGAFLEAYRAIIAAACALLSSDRFACWVVSEVRYGQQGLYRNLIGETVRAFTDAGCAYYNEAAYVTPIGSLHLLAGRTFNVSRKLGRCHQSLLTFVKGDPWAAAKACGEQAIPIAADDSAEGGPEWH